MTTTCSWRYKIRPSADSFERWSECARCSNMKLIQLDIRRLFKMAGIAPMFYQNCFCFRQHIFLPRGTMSDQFVQMSFVNRGIQLSPLLLSVVLIVCSLPLTAQETQENKSNSPFTGIEFRQIDDGKPVSGVHRVCEA